jgi:hypothetical protein
MPPPQMILAETVVEAVVEAVVETVERMKLFMIRHLKFVLDGEIVL